MERIRCRPLARDEVDRAVSVQLAAFIADPVMRWLWPEAHDYVRCFPRLVHGFGGGAFAHGGADVADGFVGGTLWLPPGVHPDEPALEALMRDTVAEPTRSEVSAVMEQMAACHPKEPHWHLTFIGVDVAHQGQGVGADLMRHRLAQLDAAGVHAYLESSNPRNVPFYRRHGFDVVREIRVGGSPVVTPMVRAPR